jgi:hypothetical protein
LQLYVSSKSALKGILLEIVFLTISLYLSGESILQSMIISPPFQKRKLTTKSTKASERREKRLASLTFMSHSFVSFAFFVFAFRLSPLSFSPLLKVFASLTDAEGLRFNSISPCSLPASFVYLYLSPHCNNPRAFPFCFYKLS